MLKKKLFRNLWHYKGQFFTIFLMVFIGILVFSGVHGYIGGMQDLWITNTNISDSDLERLKSIDHVHDVNRALILNSKLKEYKDVTLETNILEENTFLKCMLLKGENMHQT